MPCYTPDANDYAARVARRAKLEKRFQKEVTKKKQLEAMFCAVLTVLEGNTDRFQALLDSIDWVEAGVTKDQLVGWWEDHKREDAERRAKEQEVEDRRRAKKEAKENKERLKKAALEKLTPEERKALGIK
jgi:hypothetical protein